MKWRLLLDRYRTFVSSTDKSSNSLLIQRAAPIDQTCRLGTWFRNRIAFPNVTHSLGSVLPVLNAGREIGGQTGEAW